MFGEEGYCSLGPSDKNDDHEVEVDNAEEDHDNNQDINRPEENGLESDRTSDDAERNDKITRAEEEYLVHEQEVEEDNDAVAALTIEDKQTIQEAVWNQGRFARKCVGLYQRYQEF